MHGEFYKKGEVRLSKSACIATGTCALTKSD